MKKKIILILSLVIILIAAGVFWVYRNNVESSREQNKAEEAKETPVGDLPLNDDPINQPSGSPGTYQEISSQPIGYTDQQVVFFFHAPWCPQCRQLDSEISDKYNNGELPSGLAIYKVDYDSNQSLRQDYGVTLQTTFVAFDGDGNQTRKYVAYEEPTYESLKTNFLDKL